MKILSVLMLFLTLTFSNSNNPFETKANLKELQKTYKKYEDADLKNYILGAEYYFGQGKEQNIKVAKDIFQKNDYDGFMIIYSKELKKLIDAEVIPTQNTGVNLIEKSLEIYKKTNSKDAQTINMLNYMINSWNQNTIKYSPDKKSKVIEYKADFLTIDNFEGYSRSSFVEIESPYGKVSFKDFTFEPFDFAEEYLFLDNQKLLVHFVSNTASGTYIIDLNTFEMNLIDYGSLASVQTINSEKIINLGLKGYHDEGGAFWYGKSYNSNGIELKNETLNNFMNDFDKAHNTKNSDLLNIFYSNTISYYNSKNFSKENVLKDKKRLFKKYSNFNMKSKILGIQQETENDFTIIYRKDVIYGNNNKKFDSYLKVKIIGEKVFIKEENDVVESI